MDKNPTQINHENTETAELRKTVNKNTKRASIENKWEKTAYWSIGIAL